MFHGTIKNRLNNRIHDTLVATKMISVVVIEHKVLCHETSIHAKLVMRITRKLNTVVRECFSIQFNFLQLSVNEQVSVIKS